MESQDQVYKRGFNHGYLLTKHNPSLINKVAKSIKGNNTYEQSLLDGKQEYEKEIEKSRSEELRNIRNKNRGRELGREIE